MGEVDRPSLVFICSLVLQVADSYPLSASRARTNELALLGAALIG
jgi:hypothetical protein